MPKGLFFHPYTSESWPNILNEVNLNSQFLGMFCKLCVRKL
jgi:hypothetical protein